MPVCRICGKKFELITWSHLRLHNMTVNEYKERFPDARIESERLKKMHPSGKNHPFYGKRHTEESKRKNRLSHLGKELSKEHRNTISRALEGKKKSAEHARHISEGKKGIHTSPATEFKKGHRQSEEARRKMSLAKKRRITNDPEYAEELMERLSLGGRHPNKAELRLLKILQREDASWRYVGDKTLVIDGKCPDFTDDKGHLIELFGAHWHEPEEEQERINFFKERGYDCRVIWDYELDELEP